MEKWADWYARLFNFRPIRYFNIEGRLTGLSSKAMCSPCARIRIPINESADEKSQIEEYLRDYRGEGIQHVACGCHDIYASVQMLRERGVDFMPSPPGVYYEKVDARLPGHGEPLDRLRKLGILIDGEGVVEGGYTKVLLQIFSKTVIGPIFFELIQRKGDEGFGEGNFQALFESIEEDQIRRGVLKDERGLSEGADAGAGPIVLPLAAHRRRRGHGPRGRRRRFDPAAASRRGSPRVPQPLPAPVAAAHLSQRENPERRRHAPALLEPRRRVQHRGRPAPRTTRPALRPRAGACPCRPEGRVVLRPQA